MSVQLVATDIHPSPRSAWPSCRLSARQHGDRERALDVNAVRAIAERALAEAKDGRATASWQHELEALDRSARFSKEALHLFQDLQARLGVPTERPILLPLNSQPFWHRTPHPFANYQSTPELPNAADVVVIGAGLTGTAAAYRLKDTDLRVVLLDQGDPAGEASGRNGGNFELLPENSVGIYEGLAPGRFTFMRRRYPKVPVEVLQALSERQASVVLGLALRNRDVLKDTIFREGISCDFSPKGWLHLAANAREEQGLCDEVSLAAQHGQRIAIWSRGKIAEEFGIEANFLGRFIPGDGTYHPFKYVCGQLRSALRGGITLYTRTRVRRIVSVHNDEHHVVTERGTISARRVIVATNAFTRDLLPELARIEPYQSQIMITEHVGDRARGRIVTSDEGPVFFNQPREGARNGRACLIMGGGDDRPMTNPASRRRSPEVHARLMALRDRFYPELVGQPPSAEWVGPMAFTPDGLPCIGFLRPGLVIAAGYNGYGGSYTTAAGHAAAEMAITDAVPESLPEEVFSPLRLLSDEPLFLTERKGLWRVAASLCQQIQSVNRRLSDALTLQQTAPAVPASSSVQVTGPCGHSRPADGMEPESLTAFESFRKFSRDEARELLRLMRRWDLRKGTVIFAEGTLGGTCFVIVEGAVDVSINARGQQQRLATLNAGSVFGQMSLIDAAPRSATCSVRADAVLLEIEREPCEKLLSSGSALALKFLATLNEGLILALRSADLRLMQLERAELQETSEDALASTASEM
jgi:glycine/D-amino acid oxidase-like deaminating enzyme/CRP-like cAMP-binding protein/post-segregation antitoxin (ccd killing protein)